MTRFKQRTWKLVPVLLLVGFVAVVSGSAMARGGGGGGSHAGGGHGGHSHGGGHGYRWGGVALGFGFGSLYWPGYYWPGYYGGYYPYPYAYYDPAYYYPAPPAAYVEQGVPQTAPPPPAQAQLQPQPQADWFYCAGAKVYYPYVRECAGGWQRVPSTPPDWIPK